MRHAKTEPFAAQDRARRLTDRGHADAAASGRWLAGAAPAPEEVFVSAAVRAEETWQDLAQALPEVARVHIDDELYGAAPDDVLAALRSADPDSRTVLVVGHNPTVALLANQLDDGNADPQALVGLASGFPTAAMAVFAVPGAWADLSSGAARLVGFHLAGD